MLFVTRPSTSLSASEDGSASSNHTDVNWDAASIALLLTLALVGVGAVIIACIVAVSLLRPVCDGLLHWARGGDRNGSDSDGDPNEPLSLIEEERRERRIRLLHGQHPSYDCLDGDNPTDSPTATRDEQVHFGPVDSDTQNSTAPPVLGFAPSTTSADTCRDVTRFREGAVMAPTAAAAAAAASALPNPAPQERLATRDYVRHGLYDQSSYNMLHGDTPTRQPDATEGILQASIAAVEDIFFQSASHNVSRHGTSASTSTTNAVSTVSAFTDNTAAGGGGGGGGGAVPNATPAGAASATTSQPSPVLSPSATSTQQQQQQPTQEVNDVEGQQESHSRRGTTTSGRRLLPVANADDIDTYYYGTPSSLQFAQRSYSIPQALLTTTQGLPPRPTAGAVPPAHHQQHHQSTVGGNEGTRGEDRSSSATKKKRRHRRRKTSSSTSRPPSRNSSAPSSCVDGGANSTAEEAKAPVERRRRRHHHEEEPWQPVLVQAPRLVLQHDGAAGCGEDATNESPEPAPTQRAPIRNNSCSIYTTDDEGWEEEPIQPIVLVRPGQPQPQHSAEVTTAASPDESTTAAGVSQNDCYEGTSYDNGRPPADDLMTDDLMLDMGVYGDVAPVALPTRLSSGNVAATGGSDGGEGGYLDDDLQVYEEDGALVAGYVPRTIDHDNIVIYDGEGDETRSGSSCAESATSRNSSRAASQSASRSDSPWRRHETTGARPHLSAGASSSGAARPGSSVGLPPLPPLRQHALMYHRQQQELQQRGNQSARLPPTHSAMTMPHNTTAGAYNYYNNGGTRDAEEYHRHTPPDHSHASLSEALSAPIHGNSGNAVNGGEVLTARSYSAPYLSRAHEGGSNTGDSSVSHHSSSNNSDADGNSSSRSTQSRRRHRGHGSGTASNRRGHSLHDTEKDWSSQGRHGIHGNAHADERHPESPANREVERQDYTDKETRDYFRSPTTNWMRAFVDGISVSPDA